MPLYSNIEIAFYPVIQIVGAHLFLLSALSWLAVNTLLLPVPSGHGVALLHVMSQKNTTLLSHDVPFVMARIYVTLPLVVHRCPVTEVMRIVCPYHVVVEVLQLRVLRFAALCM